MEKIRLAFLHEYLPFGGVEQHILQLCRHLDRSRFSITLLLSRLGGPMMPLFEELGIPIEIFPVAPIPGPNNLPASLALIERLKEFDIAHGWYYGGPPSTGLQAAALAGRPAIVQSIAWLVTAMETFSDAVVLESDALLKIQEDMGIKTQMRRINPGIDLERFNPEKVRPAIEYDRPVAGFIARLVPAKDPETFVRAAAQVRQRRPEVKFLMVGDGPLRQPMESLAQELGADIDFLGATADVPGILASLDIYALPSLGESFGFTNAEAAAMGLAVISTRAGATPEFIIDAESGILIPPRDVDSLAQAICYLAERPDVGRVLGGRAREIIAERYEVKRYAREHAQLYEDLVRQREQIVSDRPGFESRSRQIALIEPSHRSREQILILQSNGQRNAGNEYRKCFSLQRAFLKLGYETETWGPGHESFRQPFEEVAKASGLILIVENEDFSWLPELGPLTANKAFWTSGEEQQIERDLALVRRHQLHNVFTASRASVERFAIESTACWLPEAFDGFLIGRPPQVPLTDRIGLCWNDPQEKTWADELEWPITCKQRGAIPDVVYDLSGYRIHLKLNLSTLVQPPIFETLGCGVFLLTNETPDLLKLFTPGEHLATFIGQEDLNDKLNFYTSNHEDRERIARQGHEYARREHTYLRRAEQMVEEMTIRLSLPGV